MRFILAIINKIKLLSFFFLFQIKIPSAFFTNPKAHKTVKCLCEKGNSYLYYPYNFFVFFQNQRNNKKQNS